MNAILFTAVDEIVFEYRCEYRGAVYFGVNQLARCSHRHQNPAAARRCARRLMKNLELEQSMISFTVSSRQTKDADWQRHDSYDTFEVAKEMAIELASFHRHYEVTVSNAKGVEVFNSRKAGIKPMRKQKQP